MFDFLYNISDDEKLAFGKNWCGGNKYEPWKETLIAKYRTPDKSDGQAVEVYCTAAPARFYTLKVLPGKDSVGEEQFGYHVTTGSDQEELAALLATKISDGMIGFSSDIGGIENQK